MKFKDKVINVVRLIPKGRVVSYGQVALYLGLPRAGRQVGWVLNRLDERKPEEDIPWWRVVNNQGRISIKGSKFSAVEQRNLLLAENVLVKTDLTFEIEKYRFLPDDRFIKSLKLDESYLEMLNDKLSFARYFKRKRLK